MSPERVAYRSQVLEAALEVLRLRQHGDGGGPIAGIDLGYLDRIGSPARMAPFDGDALLTSAMSRMRSP